MAGLRSFLYYWLPVIGWMTLIFAGSGDAQSGVRGSRLIAPIVRFFRPNIAPEDLDVIVYGVRKVAHLTEYAMLSLLIWRARRQPGPGDRRLWRWSDARFTLLVCLLYAASDEWHQLYVPHREASVRDVVIDGLGAIGGLGFVWIGGRWTKRS